ncbi:MAG: HRDC domain-containing protein [Desulfobacterales bacterium]
MGAVKEKVQMLKNEPETKAASPVDGLDAPGAYIERPEDLKRAAKFLGRHARLAVDLEADSMYHYQERVCLIQLAAAGQGYLVDPLVLPDLSPLKSMFQDASILKIFHGADYDIRSLYRDFTIRVGPLFDTELASRFLGYSHSGLEAMVKALLDVDLDKRFQKKDWSQRPLPRAMVAYALGDACYLLPLSEMLEAALKEKGRWRWVQEECELLSAVRPAQDNGDPLYLKFKGAGRLKPRQLAVLEKLLRFRDREARRKDRPWFKIIGSAPLLAVVQKQPQSLNALEKSGALSRRQFQMYGEAMVACVQEALALDEADLPAYPRYRAPRPDPAVTERMKVLKRWRDKLAADLELDGALLLNKALMGRIAAAEPRNLDELSRVEGLRSWQLSEFGGQIIDTLSTHSSRPSLPRRPRRKKRKH